MDVEEGSRYALPVRGELRVVDWLAEVEVMENDSPLEVDEQCATVYIDWQENTKHVA